MDHEFLFNDITSNEQLDSKRLEMARTTRFPSPKVEHDALSNEQKIEHIAQHFYEIMKILGLDMEDVSLQRTPHRVAKMYVEEIFSGLNPNTFPAISLFDDDFQHGERSNMVFVKVNFSSFCEHHFVPMNGTAYIAYTPNGKLIGLSKIPKIVQFFARRPQLQERLTAQIADSLSIVVGSDNVAVSLHAMHHCMIARGVESTNSNVTTNVLRGNFDSDASLRQQFFDAIIQS